MERFRNGGRGRPDPGIRRVEEAVDIALATRQKADVSWLSPAPLWDSWALAPDSLGFLSQLLALLRPRHVLELGAGASTRVLARAASRRQPRGHVSSVDHDPEFVARVLGDLKRDGTSGVVHVQLAPLVARRHFGAVVPIYHWNRAAFKARGSADLVLIDGPPRLLGGRQGTLYQVLEVSTRGTLILLDDASRSEEEAALAKWTQDFGRAIDVRLLPGLERGMAAILVRDVERANARCREDRERRKTAQRARARPVARPRHAARKSTGMGMGTEKR